MALSKQNFTLQMGQGVDTKTDPKQVVAGKLIELENATFQSTNRLTKRPGTSELAAAAPLSSGNAIQAFQDELIVMDGKTLNSYSATTDSIISKGTKLSIDLSVSSVVKNSYQQNAPDSSINGGVALYAWQQFNGNAIDAVGYSVVDVATGQALSQSKLTSGTINPKVVNIGSYLVLFYVESNTLKAQAFSSTSPLSAPTGFTVGALNSNGIYDAAEIINGSGGSDGVIIAYTNASSVINYRKIDSSLVLGSVQSFAANATRISVFMNVPSPTLVRIAYYDGTDVKVIHDTYPLGTQSGPYTIETVSGVANVTGIFTGATTCQYFYEINNSDTMLAADNYVRTNIVTGTSVGSASDFMRSVCLWSKPWKYGTSYYLCCVHDSPLQSTYFVFDFNKNTVAKIAPNNGGNQSYNGLLREVNNVSANVFEMTYCFKDLVESVNGDVYTQTGINSVNMTMNATLVSESLGNNLNVSGGIVSAYDGQTIAEQNFNLYPEEISVSQSTTGGSLSQGSYQYTAIYEWTDAQGQVHQSNTSVPVTINTNFETLYSVPGSNSNQTSTTDGINFRNYGTSLYTNNASLQQYPDNIQIGQQVSGPNIVAGSYYNNIVPGYLTIPGALLQHYVVLSNNVTGLAPQPTNSMLPTFYFPGTSTIGNKTISLTQNSAATYTGTITAGSNVISVNTTKGLHAGQTIIWAGAQFGTNPPPYITITSVGTNTITISLTPTQSVTNQNLIVQNYHSVTWQGAAVNYFDVTLTSSDVPFFVGQRLFFARTPALGGLDKVPPGEFWSFGAAFGSIPAVYITGWTLTSGTTYRVYLNINKTAGSSPFTDILFLGMTQHHLLTLGQSVTSTANFPGTVKIQSIAVDSVTVDTKANASGGMALVSQIGASSVVSVPTLRVTDKPTSKPVSIAIYRTLVNENLFYRLTSFTTPLLNIKTVDRLTFVDNTLDSELLGNEQLYTTGGVLSNTSPPALTQFTQYKNRLIGISSEDPYTWWFSKQVTPNVPVQFTPFFYKKIAELGGGLTALGVMDDKLIFFKRSSIYMVVGLGPNNLGLQDDFNDAELITTDTGCTEPKSIIRTPLGLMYKSGKGIYLINRGLNVQYVGAPVEAYNSNRVTSAELIENVNQVRFTLDTGVALVYDYYFDQWSVFTSVNAADSCLFQTKFTYLRPDGRIFKETPGVWTDGGSPIYLRLKTSWVSMNGMQGFERIYNMMVLGDYKSPHTLTAKVRHEFDSTVNQTTAVPIASDPGVYQYKVYMTRQKTDAMQFELIESQSGPTYGEGLDISAITMQVGVKSGTNKLPAGKLYG